MAMGKPPKYSGPLATPIDVRKLSLHKLSLGVDLEALVLEELSKKFDALIDHYQIDRALPSEQLYFMLAHRLAFDHVAGFRIINSQKRGANPKWTLDECRALVDTIHANKTQKGLKAAITKAMNRREW